MDKLKQHVVKHNTSSVSPFAGIKQESNNSSMNEDAEDFRHSPGLYHENNTYGFSRYDFLCRIWELMGELSVYLILRSDNEFPSDGSGCFGYGSFSALSGRIQRSHGGSSTVGDDDVSRYFVYTARYARAVLVPVW